MRRSLCKIAVAQEPYIIFFWLTQELGEQQEQTPLCVCVSISNDTFTNVLL